MNEHGTINRSDEELQPFEYVDINGDRACCFQLFCNCGALDSTCDKVFACDCASVDLETVFEDVTDRIRIPWAGGAMKVNNHAVAVTTLFCFFLIVGSINFIGLMLSSTVFLIFLVRMYRYVIKSGVKSMYFFLLSMLHTVTSMVLYSCKIFSKAESIHIYYFYFWLIVYLSVLYVFKQDAGKVPAVQSKETSHILFCDKCSVIRPVRAAHCRFCNVCVDKYDHHNIWFDQCVGSHNHLSYMLLLISLTNLTLSTAWDFFTRTCGYQEVYPNIFVPNCNAYILSNRSSVLFAIGLFSLVVFLVTLFIMAGQIRLITFNLTGYEERGLKRGYPIHDEMLKSHYFHSPFSMGAWRNWGSFITSGQHKVVNKNVESL